MSFTKRMVNGIPIDRFHKRTKQLLTQNWNITGERLTHHTDELTVRCFKYALVNQRDLGFSQVAQFNIAKKLVKYLIAYQREHKIPLTLSSTHELIYADIAGMIIDILGEYNNGDLRHASTLLCSFEDLEDLVITVNRYKQVRSNGVETRRLSFTVEGEKYNGEFRSTKSVKALKWVAKRSFKIFMWIGPKRYVEAVKLSGSVLRAHRLIKSIITELAIQEGQEIGKSETAVKEKLVENFESLLIKYLLRNI